MKLTWHMKSFTQHVVLSELLCALFITELSGRPHENAIIHCENYASVIQTRKFEESDENTNTSSSHSDRWNAYSIRDKKWHKRNLTFAIKGYSTQFPREAQDEAMGKALKKWADVSTLTFQKMPYEQRYRADILVEFVKNWTSGHRAWGFYPGTGVNTLQFADNIRWTIDERGGANFLLRTATHEMGHALGIQHSNVPSSIMYGGSSPARSNNYSLDNDDILAIQRLYGPNPNGYKPNYDPGPSMEAPGNEPIYLKDTNECICYRRIGGKWVLHGSRGNSWVPISASSLRSRMIPPPPKDIGYTRSRNTPPVNRGNTPPVNQGNTTPVNRGNTPPVNRGYNPTANRGYNPTVNGGYYNPTINRRHTPTVNRRYYPRGIRGYQVAESSSSSSAITSSEEGSSESTTSEGTSSESTTSEGTSSESTTSEELPWCGMRSQGATSNKPTSGESSTGSEETKSGESNQGQNKGQVK